MKKQKTNSNPFADRNLHSILAWPSLSWSSFCAFTEYDKEEWYQKYVLNIRNAPNSAMKAGIEIGERLANDPSYLPEVPRPEIYEKEIQVKLGQIQLLGHIDGFSPKRGELLEYKTTQNKNRWNQKSVDEHGQITFYCLLLFLKYQIKPEDIKLKLVSIPVEMNGSFEVKRSAEPISIIETQRSMMQILLFGALLKNTWMEMRQYVAQRRLTEDKQGV